MLTLNGVSDDPLILTATFDAASAQVFGDLRRRYFPPGRNIVPAHLTLFHHLPGTRLADCLADLVALRPDRTAPFETGALRFLGRGVAIDIGCQPLEAVRQQLAERWAALLTPQDRQRFRPHVTIQNKATPAEARALHGRLLTEFVPFDGAIVGLDLWHYRGGPWEPAAHSAWSADA